MNKGWHAMPLSDVERELNTSLESGLSMSKARKRAKLEQKAQGSKRKYLFAPSDVTPVRQALSAMLDPCMLLLLVTSLLAVLFGSSKDAALVFAVAVICCAAGIIMSYTSAKRLRAASDYSSPVMRVIRGGDKYYTDGRNIVTGDVILLSEGDLVPCDARIIEGTNLVVKELISTADGIKNRLVTKDFKLRYLKEDAVTAPNARNILYAGSAIVSGTAKAVATETGSDVYLAEFLKDGGLVRLDSKTEFEKRAFATVRSIRAISVSLLVILTLVSLVFADATSLVNGFLALLSIVALISNEILAVGINFVYSSYIYKLSKQKRSSSARRGDLSATVKSVGILDKLKDITSLVLVGKAGITRGAFRACDVYTGGETRENFTPEDEQGARILPLIYTYVKALRTCKCETDAISGDIALALDQHVKTSGFDFAAWDIYLRSLHYVSDDERGYACAETADSQFRVALTLDESILEYCELIRKNGECEEIGEQDRIDAKAFCQKARDRGAVCLYVVVENEGAAALESIVSMEQSLCEGLDWTLSELESVGIKTYIFLDNESDAGALSSKHLGEKFSGRTALASGIADTYATSKYDSFRVFAGYTKEQYLAIAEHMRASGERLAVFSVDNQNNAILTSADVGISCDSIRYDTEKYKSSAFLDLPCSGSDSNVRASSQTRFFSGVIVKRAHANGGGLSSLLNAISIAKTASLSVRLALSMCLCLLSAVIPFAVVSVFARAPMLESFMVISLGALACLLPFMMLTETDYKSTSYKVIGNTVSNVRKTLLTSVISRASLSMIFAISVLILDTIGIFGDDASYSIAIFIGILLSTIAEAVAFEAVYTKNGDGRARRWIKLILSYAVMLLLCSVATQDGLSGSVVQNGIGTYEFLLVPVYLVCYVLLIVIQHAVRRKGNKE